MIAKITHGAGFRGTLAYVLQKDHKPEIVGGNMSGTNPRDLAREFAAVRELRPDVGKPVVHVSLSFDPGRDGHPGDRRLTNEELARISGEYLRRMGYDIARVQWVAVRHNDKGHEHVHLVLSRIRIDGTLVHQPWEFLKSQRICRDLEKNPRFGLRPVRAERDPGSRAPTRGEDRMFRDRGILSQKERLKGLIRDAARGQPTMTEFLERLRASGVHVRPNLARTGHVSGISYRLGQVAVRGSHLGRAYSWEGLQRLQGVRHLPARDLGEVRRTFRASFEREAVRAVKGWPMRVLTRELRYLAEGLALGQVPAALRAASLVRSVAALGQVGREPSVGNAVRAGLRLVPGLDPRLLAVAHLLKLALPRSGREPGSPDPHVEREIPFRSAGLEPERDR